jgi:predicted enzyme related to lactoylglutathione lyase
VVIVVVKAVKLVLRLHRLGVDFVAAWNVLRRVPFIKNIYHFFARQFIEQDQRIMERQAVGLRDNPHLILIDDADQQARWYSQLIDAHLMGRHQMFAWDESGRSVGSMTDIVSPGVHPQWLFFFPIADIDHSLAKVSARGGMALGRTQTSSGDIVVPCEDPQGAAFALYQIAHEET